MNYINIVLSQNSNSKSSTKLSNKLKSLPIIQFHIQALFYQNVNRTRMSTSNSNIHKF